MMTHAIVSYWPLIDLASYQLCRDGVMYIHERRHRKKAALLILLYCMIGRHTTISVGTSRSCVVSVFQNPALGSGFKFSIYS